MTDLELMKSSADSIIDRFDKELTGIKRKNSLLILAEVFKGYEIRCIRLSNKDK